MQDAPGPALAHVQSLQSCGLFLSAYDAAMAAIAAGEDTPALRHAAVLALARGGARGTALRLVDRWDLRAADDEEIAGLYPRLLKDLALESRDPSDALTASAAYERLWQRTGNAWPGVNAAAMQLLAGERDASRAIAAALTLQSGDTGDYWPAATQAEICLLRGAPGAAHRWLAEAEARAGADMSCRATTRRQLRWEALLLGIDTALVKHRSTRATASRFDAN